MPERTTIPPQSLLAHLEWVRGRAAELVHGAADADDVAQETWRRALERPPRHPGNLRHGPALVTRNVARQFGRGERTRRAHEECAAAPAEAAGVPILDDPAPPGDQWHGVGTTTVLLASGTDTTIARALGGGEVRETFVAAPRAQVVLTLPAEGR
jgi:DNA-directed RNA polymerase specialized sigma24 family protein